MRLSPWALVADWLLTFPNPGRSPVIGLWAWLGINSNATVALDDPKITIRCASITSSHRALANHQKRRSKTDAHR